MQTDPVSAVPEIQSGERFYRMVHQLVQGGSLSAAYQRLTQPGLCPTDPLPRFLEIHRDIDLTSLHLHPASVQDVRDNTDWEAFFAPGDVYRLIARRKNGKASDRRGMRNEFLKILQQDPAFLHFLSKPYFEALPKVKNLSTHPIRTLALEQCSLRL